MDEPTPKSKVRLAVFETALGWIGIEWGANGLTRLRLPDPNRARLEQRLLRGVMSGGAAVIGEALAGNGPDWVFGFASAVRTYAAGEAADLAAVPIDLSGVEPFRRAIYLAARTLRYGETVTYGQLAERAGYPGMARETGAALGRNPIPLVVPCHRIVAAGGKLGGFSAPGGAATKRMLLALEGVALGQSARQQSLAL